MRSADFIYFFSRLRILINYGKICKKNLNWKFFWSKTVNTRLLKPLQGTFILSNMRFLHFFMLGGGGGWLNPDPLTQLNPDPIWIRIRNTDSKSIVLSSYWYNFFAWAKSYASITMLKFVKFLWTDISAAADAAIITIREQTKLEETLFKDGIIVQ